jgi:CRP-like cAMP-binding protein
MNEVLDKILNEYGIKSPENRKLFRELSAIKTYSKNREVLAEGKKNDMEYLLLSGVLHRYNISDKGDIITTGFYLPGSVITPHFARTTSGKNIFNLQALTELNLVEIPVEVLDKLRTEYAEFREFGQRVLETELSRTFFNEVIYRSYNAKERLLAMREQYPNLENLVPHNVIASYLGITNVSFSRLRNELSKK